MADRPTIDQKARTEASDAAPDGFDGVSTLASEALARVAQRSGMARAVADLELVQSLMAATQSGGIESCLEWLEAASARGIEDQEIVDLVIPAAARTMGDRWCEDTMSFVAVTVGVAHLQSLLRHLDNRAAEPALDAPLVLVTIVDDVNHTLGAMVLVSRLRRHGVFVHAVLDGNRGALARALKSYDIDAVFVSTSATDDLASIADSVNFLRKNGPANLPIVAGGTGTPKTQEIKALIGVDHICDDPEDALYLCQLTVPTRGRGATRSSKRDRPILSPSGAGR
ncbi:MAG: cobalamin-dependent protein [Pseudomonadota bacterium]